jgi:hypothetical protein
VVRRADWTLSSYFETFDVEGQIVDNDASRKADGVLLVNQIAVQRRIQEKVLNQYDQIFFDPWIGRNYFAGYENGQRLLVLGESHYLPKDDPDPCESEIKRYTDTTIRDFIDKHGPTGNDFAGRLHRLLTNHRNPTRDQIEDAWNRVAYENYIPVLVGRGAVAEKTPEHWQLAKATFKDRLDKLRPDKVLVLGKVNWGRIHQGDWVGGNAGKGKEWRVDGDVTARGLWQFKVDSDSWSALATWIYHPAWGRDFKRARAVLDSLLAEQL